MAAGCLAVRDVYCDGTVGVPQMIRVAPLVIAFILVLVAAGGAVFGLSLSAGLHGRPETGPPNPPTLREGNQSAPPATADAPRADGTRGGEHSGLRAAAPAGAATAPARAGRVLSLDDAFRELDLIRPSREKYAEDFSLPLADGSRFRLSEHRGKTILINFWATWCPPCREEMPALERLYRQHKDHGLVLVAVSLDADPKVVPPYVRASKLTFPVALDPKAEVGNAYGVRALPSSFVVNRQGTMTALALGPRVWDNDASHSLVEALARR
jgi:peroxiredoxin